MNRLYRDLLELLDEGTPCALATVVSTQGSTPQKAGAQALFAVDGRLFGTVGGGCLEMEVRRQALSCLSTGQPTTLDLRLDEDVGAEGGLVCGGTAQVFIEVPTPAQREFYAQVMQVQEQRQPAALATVIKAEARTLIGGHALLPSEGKPTLDRLPPTGLEPLQEVASTALEQGQSRLLEATLPEGKAQVYVEPLLPQPVLLIAGAGHVGKAVAHLGSFLNFEVVVVDDRPEFANPQRIPEANRLLVADIASTIANWPIDSDTYIVIVTRGHRYDADALRACIQSQAAYLGMIGSRRKVKLIFDQLLTEGTATPEQLARVHAPIGLPLGGDTVEEIALSIAAELVAVRNERREVRS
ncbi:MAG TPA: XdhC/CoxI family protein [Armatimonadetes bacterium]|nr:XdhC/CoxI family protein [Armatimonadota bacterium]